ncbi:MAG TPA: FkbM family methyltransferase [Acetobacteraceae bacterium]|nr:FkbM family methyltransferase [Acetobacteraceae bacterium]
MSEALFARFHPGHIDLSPGFHPTWAGSLIRNEFDGNCYSGQPSLEPSRDEEWFEWHSLLTAVSEARGRFVMAEIGAGYGRWAVAGAVAAQRVGAPSSLVCVEAEPGHFAMLGQHMRDNGIDPAQHRLIEGAATWRDAPVYFTVGKPREWWGQLIVSSTDEKWDGDEVRTVPGISLATALRDIPYVDLIDMDIQGAEADVVESSLPLLRERVRRLHIGTHGPEIEARLRVALRSIDFRPAWDFPWGRTVETPIGRVAFQDGVQTWVNPSFP